MANHSLNTYTVPGMEAQMNAGKNGFKKFYVLLIHVIRGNI